MPRSRRLIFPGAPHHVIQRGHNKERCFFRERDFVLYLGLLQEYARKHGCQIHAYVLMTNHVHLLVTPGDERSISEMLRSVHQQYVQFVNREYGRCGSAWQGRFHLSYVDTASYFMTCQRYIELNPVRAGMVQRAGDYAWSSHRHNAFGAPCGLLTPHATYLSLAESEDRRRSAYRELFRAEIPEDCLQRIRIAAAGNRPLGDDAFLESLRPIMGEAVTRQQPGPKPRPKAIETMHDQLF
jgi:putative transposase